MGFNKISQYSYYCDECGEIYVYDGWRRVEAEKEARAAGWALIKPFTQVLVIMRQGGG